MNLEHTTETTETTPEFENPQQLLTAISSVPELANALRFLNLSYRGSCDLYAALRAEKPSAIRFLEQDIIENARTPEQLARIFQIIQACAVNLQKERDKKENEKSFPKDAASVSNIIKGTQFGK